MIFASTNKNLNIMTASLITTLLVSGFFTIDVWSGHWLVLSMLAFYTINILGLYLMYHRYYAHRSFEFRYQWLEYLFLTLAILSARGSPLAWVYIHRLHHRNSDTEIDPHQSKKLNRTFSSFFVFPQQHDLKIFVIKDMMTLLHLFIHHYYLLIISVFAVVFAAIDFTAFYFLWLLPVVLIHLAQQNFNFWAHTRGYKNHNTTDNSKNNIALFLILLGECWHNNHHYDPKNYSTQQKKFEFDPLGGFIKWVKK